jgi:hypothetical protein
VQAEYGHPWSNRLWQENEITDLKKENRALPGFLVQLF